VYERTYLSSIQNSHFAGHQWLTPVILVTQEAEIRRIRVRSQSRANSLWDPSPKNPSPKKEAGRVAQVVKSACLTSLKPWVRTKIPHFIWCTWATLAFGVHRGTGVSWSPCPTDTKGTTVVHWGWNRWHHLEGIQSKTSRSFLTFVGITVRVNFCRAYCAPSSVLTRLPCFFIELHSSPKRPASMDICPHFQVRPQEIFPGPLGYK
jgi:hypothetical protein